MYMIRFVLFCFSQCVFVGDAGDAGAADADTDVTVVDVVVGLVPVDSVCRLLFLLFLSFSLCFNFIIINIIIIIHFDETIR